MLGSLARAGCGCVSAAARSTFIGATRSCGLRTLGPGAIARPMSTAAAAVTEAPQLDLDLPLPRPSYIGCFGDVQPRETHVHHPLRLPQIKPPELESPDGLEPRFAVVDIKTKQYKVTKDDLIISDKIEGLEAGMFLECDKVYLVGTRDYTVVGRPFVENVKVKLQVEEQTKDAKVIIFKKKRRKGYKRKKGFRREVTILRVLEIDDRTMTAQ